ncbi:MAG: VWA domain-containing protein [Oscillospiraceae bacterium]|nr:VWA domain-containing protein [Oscillospiraceae bacterium]
MKKFFSSTKRAVAMMLSIVMVISLFSNHFQLFAFAKESDEPQGTTTEQTQSGDVQQGGDTAVVADSEDPVETTFNDTTTGVTVVATVPKGTTVKVTKVKTPPQGTENYLIWKNSAFYTVEFTYNGQAYVPENGIKIKFPATDLASQDASYYAYQLEADGTVNYAGPYEYDFVLEGLSYEKLSVIGVAMELPVDSQEIESYEAQFVSDKVTLYSDFAQTQSVTVDVTADDIFTIYPEKYIVSYGNSQFEVLSIDLYEGENQALIDALMPEDELVNPYWYVMAEDVKAYVKPDPTPDAPVIGETTFEDKENGVTVTAGLPQGTTLDKTKATYQQIVQAAGTQYPLSENSLFFDFALEYNDAPYQPQEKITVTFAEGKIPFEKGAVYNTYHIHGDTVDVSDNLVYTGGDITVQVDSFSYVGLSENANYSFEYIDEYRAVFKTETGTFYAGFELDIAQSKSFAVTDSDIFTVYAKYVITNSDNTTTEVFIIAEGSYEGTNSELGDAIYPADWSQMPYNHVLGTDIKAYVESTPPSLSEDALKAYEDLLATETITDFETVMDGIDTAVVDELKSFSDKWAEIEDYRCYLVYCGFFGNGTSAEFEAYKTKYIDVYNGYLVQHPEYKACVDFAYSQLVWHEQNPQQPEQSTVTLGEVIPYSFPSDTNVAKYLAGNPASLAGRRNMSTFNMLDGRMATFNNDGTSAQDAGDADTNNNGVVLSKTATPIAGEEDMYKIRLEAYTTGSKVTTVTETIPPTDIILILDISSSMDELMDVVGWQQVTSGTAKDIYDDNNYRDKLYAKVGDEYKKVTITGNNPVTNTTYNSYGNSNTTAKNVHDSNKTIYIKAPDGEYYEVHSNKDGNRYTAYYINANGERTNIYQNLNRDAKISSYSEASLYTMGDSTTTYDSFTFSYEGENGATETITYAPTDSVVGGTNPEYHISVVTGTQTRKEALQKSVTTFASDVAEMSKGEDGILGTDDDVNHRIAVVVYNGRHSYSETGILIGDKNYRYTDQLFKDEEDSVCDFNLDTFTGDLVTEDVYKMAFQNMDTALGIANIQASAELITEFEESGTYCLLGTEMALGILDNNPLTENDIKEQRQRVAVIFTDGEPGGNDPAGKDNNYEYDEPIRDTKVMKDAGITVFSVGILDDGNTTIPPTSTLNKYMHGMTSNYKDATSINSLGELSNTNWQEDGNYYLLASNSEELNNIFTSIQKTATSGGSITSLSTTTEVKDFISPYFVLPKGVGADDVKLYTSNYTGDDEWSAETAFNGTVVLSDDRTNVSVSGFDYTANWVGTEVDNSSGTTTTIYRGKKLIIEFPITVSDYFLGGDNVITNDTIKVTNTGIYDGATVVEKIQSPTVDVNVRDIIPVTEDQYIYITNAADVKDLITKYYVRQFGEKVDINKIINGTNNQYVDLIYNITDNEGNAVGTFTIPRGKAFEEAVENLDNWTLTGSYTSWNIFLDADHTFGISCTNFASETNNSTSSDTATVYVFKPTVTVEDKGVYFGGTKPTDEQLDKAVVSVEWKGSVAYNADNMSGTVPTLDYSYDYDAGTDADRISTLEDIPVDVTVSIKGEKPTVDTTSATVVHEDANCDLAGVKCTQTADFLLHVATARYTYSDSVYYYGIPMPSHTEANSSEWICEGKTIKTVYAGNGMINSTPVLVITPVAQSDLDAGIANLLTPEVDDVYFKVSIKAGSIDMGATGGVKFVHNTDTVLGDECTFDSSKGQYIWHIVKPTVSFDDRGVYLGSTVAAPNATTAYNNITTQWKYKDTAFTISGTTPPAITFTYDYAGGAVTTTDDIPVNATAYISDKELAADIINPHTCSIENPCTTDADFLLHVFAPQVTVQDSFTFVGSTLPSTDGNITKGDVWKDANGTASTASGVTMLGAKPAVNVTSEMFTDKTYVDGANTVITTDDIPFDVTVYIGGNDLTQQVLGRTDCMTGETAGTEWPQGAEFVVHVYSPALKLKDSNVYYGGTVPENFDGNVVGNVVWSNDILGSYTGTAPAVTVTGDVDLEYDYIHKTSDIPVTVTVTRNDNSCDITDYTAITHSDCTATAENLKGGDLLLHVFVPSYTFSDSWVHLGADLDGITNAKWDEYSLVGQADWTKADADGASADNFANTAPELTLEYTPDKTFVNNTDDIGVNVQVRTPAINITSVTEFAHDECNGEETLADNQFILHVDTPVFTFEDLGVYYASILPDNDDITDAEPMTETEWGKTQHITTEPTFSFEYDVKADADDLTAMGRINTLDDIPVEVTKVTVGESKTDVTALVDFEHDECTGDVCDTPQDFLLHIYTPQFVFQDSETQYDKAENQVDYYDAENYLPQNLSWKISDENNTETLTVVTTEQDMPEFEFTYDPDDMDWRVEQDGNLIVKATQCFHVTVTSVAVKGDSGVQLTEDTHFTFGHSVCDVCGTKNLKTFDPAQGQFMVHVHTETTDIKVVKRVKTADIAKDPDQTFVFQITALAYFSGEVETIYAVISADEFKPVAGTEYSEAAVVVDHLVAGERCTVSEDASWSWRYTAVDAYGNPTSTTQTIEQLQLPEGANTVTFINHRTQDKWLDSNGYADNRYEDEPNPALLANLD